MTEILLTIFFIAVFHQLILKIVEKNNKILIKNTVKNISVIF